MLPNFIIVGAPKAGTTSLYYYLSEHPQVNYIILLFILLAYIKSHKGIDAI